MPYINDVFISYKRGRIIEQWINEIFLPLFTENLDYELPDPPKIFIDSTGLTPGVGYWDELFVNLFYSKCIVSIWSPPYFRRSEWCVKEFLTMKHRQELWELGPLKMPKTLIWPVIYREVNPLPEIASGLQYSNYSEFNLVGDAFFKTKSYLLFQKKLQKDIKYVSEIILHAPPLNTEWETYEGKAKIISTLNEYFSKVQGIESTINQKLVTWSEK
ncbi:hypothetical protein GO755_05005 [Spirosoma sp. HMF4905]|uniref:TIR domain-containing protein n=1 Tax=Spirosoma arboris TaxID=2682092 RepID=A0A7K1S6C8_9BACT|nr:hypothetical protein [Spirosoma arboris]MVM29382.1 hypothetical protein [Spirosoma arboris]